MRSTRREFLKASLGGTAILSFGPAAPAFLARAALAAFDRAGGETILVVVQLTGGNDGLNTVIPFEDDAYGRSRPTLRIPPEKALKIAPGIGFHPQMGAFRRLFDEGRLSILQSVGYPNSDRDHDRALRDWHTARPGESACETGWLGRAIDLAPGKDRSDIPGVFVGPIDQPFALHTEKTIVPSIRSLEDLLLRSPSGVNADSPPGKSGDDLLESVRRRALEARELSLRVQAASGAASSNDAAYPPFQLAQTFRICSQLIRAELGIRVFFSELGGGGIGGFDSHANQAANHGALLRQLSESAAAFVKDLERDGLLERVLVMTFSEFGRTLAENGRHGTDHGAAAPVFLAGGKVQAGLHGPAPDLTDLEGGAPKSKTDFRRLYASVIDRWLSWESAPILGGSFEPLEILKG